MVVERKKGTTEAYEALLREVLERLGVKEIMEVYRRTRESMRVLDDYRLVTTPQLEVWTSDHTEA